MKILHFDCSMGAAGDMLSAALLELFPDPQEMVDRLNALGIPHVRYAAERAVKCGVTGTHIHVFVDGVEEGEEPHHEHHHEHEHDHHEHEHAHEHHHGHGHHHHHSSLGDIAAIVDALSLEAAVREDVLAVYESIAQAESVVHGVPVTDIHFHEVGTVDAVADVTAVCCMIRALAPDKITATPVHVGSGQVRCAHGILPVPAPATALLLQGIPMYSGDIRGELCTPTGAALLKYYVNQFGPMPLLRTEKIGYGMGKKDFPAANCVRALWGEAHGDTEDMVKLECNLDDMTGEQIGFACQALREAGAPEVFTVPVNMKKDRPGVVLTVICRPEQRQTMAEAVLRHTTTIGVRETALHRYVLSRREETVETALGPVRKKISEGYGVRREKWEYDDLSRLAGENGLSLEEVTAALER